jgi:hypothetical protein
MVTEYIVRSKTRSKPYATLAACTLVSLRAKEELKLVAVAKSHFWVFLRRIVLDPLPDRRLRYLLPFQISPRFSVPHWFTEYEAWSRV